MAKYEFKVGDRVQFKEWDEMEKEFGLDFWGNIKCSGRFTADMRHLCGTYATIKEICRDGIVYLSEFSAKGSTRWTYSTNMLKPASTKKQKKDEPKSEVKEAFGFKCGDKVKYHGVVCTVVEKCDLARNVFLIKLPQGGHDGFRYNSEPWEKLEGNIYRYAFAEELTRVDNKPITYPTITAHLIEGNKTTVMLSDGRIGEVTCYYKDTFDPAVGVAEAYKKALGITKAEDKPIVKEVKRPANIGEYVKVVDAKRNFGYQNGDILKVILKLFNAIVAADNKGEDVALWHSEYVVLEGYDPDIHGKI